MKKLILAAAILASTATSAGASTPKVVSDGVRSCTTTLTTWYHYSNGTTVTAKKRLYGAQEFTITTDPKGQTLPHLILVNYMPAVCVTVVL